MRLFYLSSLSICIVCCTLMRPLCLCSCLVNVSDFTITAGRVVKDDKVIDGPMTDVARIFIALVNKDCLYYLSVKTPPIINVVIGMYYSITVNY